MRTYTISPIPRPTLSSMGAAYLAAFGVLWLFVEPLGAFGFLSSFGAVPGIVIYAILLFAPVLVLPLFLRWYRWRKTHAIPFVALSIRSTVDGATYSLRIAENMQVGDVLYQFMDILRSGPARDQISSMVRRYYPVLQVEREGVFTDVASNLTIHSAGLRNGDECQVRAQEYEHFDKVWFSRS